MLVKSGFCLLEVTSLFPQKNLFSQQTEKSSTVQRVRAQLDPGSQTPRALSPFISLLCVGFSLRQASRMWWLPVFQAASQVALLWQRRGGAVFSDSAEALRLTVIGLSGLHTIPVHPMAQTRVSGRPWSQGGGSLPETTQTRGRDVPQKKTGVLITRRSKNES